MEEIIIWETNAETIRACQHAVSQALKDLGLKATIVVNSEPPLISRSQLWERLPVLEIREKLWSLNYGEPFTREQLVRLFRGIFGDEQSVDYEKEELMSDEMAIITDANYRETLNGLNAVVLFYKKLCPNCKALEKMLEKFFAANPEVEYRRIDSEECPEAMNTFGVSLVPTVIILKNGGAAGKKVGLMNLSEMTNFHRSV